MTGYESPLDRQIREAQERGEFDNLPGQGKPLPNRNELHDDEWWLKAMVQREGVGSGGLPTTLKLRKELEDLPETVAAKKSEDAVRKIVADLNERIAKAIRGPVDGPPVVLKLVDVEEVVSQWRGNVAS